MTWAVIGGSGALLLAERLAPEAAPESRFGAPSPGLRSGAVGGCPVLFLPRHGTPDAAGIRPGDAPAIPMAPHLINYRGNVDVLAMLGAQGVVALNTVGGISGRAATGSLVVPDQIIDYTWGRAHTFSDENVLIHVDFAEPLDGGVRERLLAAGRAAGVSLVDGGVYGCTQGPRFETAAEIERMGRDGCDLVGMTGMPEAALCRERGLAYAMLSLVVNPAAGRAPDPFDMTAIARVAAEGMARVAAVLEAFFSARAREAAD